ncbi:MULTISPECIES: hypothetical protein [Aeromonas]|uniref:hypothetical protein n=1 Tax=Aeromonas TaxID=642 RepID=UPI0005B2ED93|nr:MULTISPECIES: hypothetical protein [Aeromonas]TNH76510.1 hypothetical protein CF142_04360 [Aeromonas caviae]
MNDTIANIAADIQHQGANEYHIISNPRELAAISRAAQAGGFYDSRFEDNLAKSLKMSIQNHGYKRVSLQTPPPANIVQSLRSRV